MRTPELFYVVNDFTGDWIPVCERHRAEGKAAQLNEVKGGEYRVLTKGEFDLWRATNEPRLAGGT